MRAPISIEACVKSQAYPINVGGRYIVQFLVSQAQGLPILIDWPFGEGSAASVAAHSAAASLRRATPITAEGNSLQVFRYRGEACLRLVGAIRVTRPTPQPFHEAAAQAA
jgi:hypothetical protein